jgi:hypothetical protein
LPYRRIRAGNWKLPTMTIKENVAVSLKTAAGGEHIAERAI